MQVKETLQLKTRGRPGFTDKRFWMLDTDVKLVEDHRLNLSAKERKDLRWDEALSDLIRTHPKCK